MVHEVFWHLRSILGWSQSGLAILPYNPLIRSSRLYGQFSLDQTWIYKRAPVYLQELLQFHDFPVPVRMP